MNEEELFDRAVSLPAAARAELLDRECAGDTTLRARVEALLRADDEAAARTGPYRPASAGAATGETVGGRYRLREKIGEGGMGEVWSAEQTDPVRRMVAVKLVRADRCDSAAILARFEAERQAIALMDHPNIARLLDAGATETGAPFFVMELVAGVPLTAYCDANRLGVPERLEVFTRVCAAVQHAHTKGVIHRDLKPSNILVESRDGRPVVKVIDFGLAKAAAGPALTERTLFTGFGSVVGTPLYMAPEQAAFDAVDIDTRADVYSLGVVLYELLTGTTPLSRESARKAAIDEVFRLIREEEPPAPSSRVGSGVGRADPSSAPRLGRTLRGDLDWIVLRAISKERDRRYGTAEDFARDVERYLRHEPVAAGPPSVGYRLRKFVRRHRAAVAAAAAVALAVTAGVVATALALVEARYQAGVAKREAADAEAARAAESERADGEAKAKVAARAAEADARKAAEAEGRARRREKKVNDRMFGYLADLDVRRLHNEGVPVEAVLGKRLAAEAKELEEAFEDPAERVSQQERLGRTLMNLGYPREAVVLLDRAKESRAGIEDAAAREADRYRAMAYAAAGRYADAVRLLGDVRARYEAAKEGDSPAAVRAASDLAVCHLQAGRPRDALPLFEEVHKRTAAAGVGSREELTAAANLGNCLVDCGQSDRAVAVLEDVAARGPAVLGEGSYDLIMAANNLAFALRSAGRLGKALPVAEAAARAAVGRLGAAHPDALACLNTLAGIHRAGGRIDRAVAVYEDIYAAARGRLGNEHPRVQTARINLAVAYTDTGRAAEAVPLLEIALKGSRSKLGDEHAQTLSAMASLGNAYRAAERAAEAVPLLEDVLRRRAKAEGVEHPSALAAMTSLATAKLAAGDAAGAIKLYDSYLAVVRRGGADSADFARASGQVGEALSAAGRFAEAVPHLRVYLAGREKAGPDTWQTAYAKSAVGRALAGAKKPAEAEPLLVAAYDGLKKHAASVPARFADATPKTLDALAAVCDALGKADRAKTYRSLRAGYPPAKSPNR